jgi:two-component system KDP operon response regulator KdpE
MGSAQFISVLVVDDEALFRKVLRNSLTSGGYAVEEACSGQEALACLRARRFDLVLLDVGMPGLTGIDTCREIRKIAPLTGIVMVTVRDGEDDTVSALEAGADDYITKPFRLGELLARLAAILRRSRAPADPGPDVLRVGDLSIDLDKRTVWKAAMRIRLSPKEFDLLSLLMKNEGRSLTHMELLGTIWGPDHRNDIEYLRAYIRLLRKKIEDDPGRPQYILTESWVGYRLSNPDRKDRFDNLKGI